jgi:hypothetical protein
MLHRHHGTSFEILHCVSLPKKVGRCEYGKVTAHGLRGTPRFAQQARVCCDPCYGLGMSLAPVTRDVTLF